MFTFGALTYGLLGLLAIALLVAAVTDIRRRQIDNWLNGGIALAAPLFWWACGLDIHAIAVQLELTAAALAVLWLLFALRQMGGGDVKLLVALALWVQPLLYMRLVVLMAILGGALSLAMLVWTTLRKTGVRPVVPYGVAISGAGLWVLANEYVPFLQTAGAAG